MTKKLLGILIAAAMLLSIVPAAFAKSTPARDEAASAFWDLETDPAADGWTFTDADGDGYNWVWTEDTAAGAPIAASGTHVLRSFSYISGAGALTPDNWAITPEVLLSEDGEAALNYKIASYSGAVIENYRIYVFADGAEEPVALTEELTSPDSIRVFEERTVDLSDFAGQSVKVAFRHYNSTNQFRVFLDDVEIIGGEAQEPIETEPPVENPMIAGWYFESDPELDGWQFIDANGDGYNWFWNGESAYYAYEGYGSILSASYQNGSALTPDNWAISPAVELPNANLSATFYAKASSSGYTDEHFAVYVGTADDISEMSEALPETVTTGSYVQYTVDLSDYANQTVYIAIRHFNCYDQMRLVVDQFEVWGSEGEDPIEPTVPPTEPPVEPTVPPTEPPETPAEPELIFGSYFEEDHDPADEGWQFVDADGDTHTWMWHATSAGAAYEGSGIIGSHSYNYGWGGELHPDNWAISPAIELPAEELSVTFYARGYDAYFPVERFEVYAGTTDNIEEMSEVLTVSATTASWTQYTADLTDFANETVYIAIRHCTESGGDSLIVDQFEVWGREGETPVEPVIIGDVDGDGEVDVSDALLLMRCVMGLEELDDEQLAQADVDGDGEVTMTDCLLIQRYAMGIIGSFPAENP